MKWLLAALAAGGFYFLYNRGTFCEGGSFLCPAAPNVEAVLPKPVNYVAVPPSPYTLTAPVSQPASPVGGPVFAIFSGGKVVRTDAALTDVLAYCGQDPSSTAIRTDNLSMTERQSAVSGGVGQPCPAVTASVSDVRAAITNPPANFSIAVFSSGGGAGQM